MLIRKKLALSSFGLIVLTGLSGIVALVLLRDVQFDVRQSNEDLIPHCNSAMRMTEALLRLHAQAEELVRASVDHSTNNDALDIDPTLAELQKTIHEAEVTIKTIGMPLAERSGNAEEIATETEELKTIAAFSDDCAVLKEHILVLKGLVRTNTAAANAHLSQHIEPIIHQLLPEFKKYQDNIWDEMKEENLQIDNNVRQTKTTILASTVAAVVLVALAAFLISRSVSRPILNLQNTIRRIGSGEQDVQVDISRSDEIGHLAQAFDQMINDLRQTTVSKDYMDAVIRSMGDMLAVADSSGNLRAANEALLQTLGYTEKELLDIPFNSLICLSQVILDSKFHDALQNGSVRSFEAAFRKKDGSTLPVSISASVLRDRQSASNGVVWVAKDITARNAAQTELEKVNKSLLTASRQAGMAEVATNVLHNVGNVLNSMNISTTLIGQNLTQTKMDNVGRIAGLFRDHAGDLAHFLTEDPTGKRLPDYVQRLAVALDEEKRVLMNEVEQLRKNVDHIKDIVATQQSYARIFGVVEKTKVVDLIEDALRMNAGALMRHEVELLRDYADPALEITVDKHKVLQVLVNLIRNAKYACDDSGRTEKKITMRLCNGAGTIKIAVVDNGIGISTENMSQLFRHGFTTRKEGHGFGLHSAVLTARQMGGDLIAQSDGLQCGATFTLVLPVLPPEGAHHD